MARIVLDEKRIKKWAYELVSETRKVNGDAENNGCTISMDPFGHVEFSYKELPLGKQALEQILEMVLRGIERAIQETRKRWEVEALIYD